MSHAAKTLAHPAALPLLLLVTATAASAQGGVDPSGNCATLTEWRQDDVRVDSAEVMAASERRPEHCKVSGTIGAEVHFELLLPTPEAWKGRFIMGGGGGFVGSIQNTAMELPLGGNALQRGYATVGTDTGHTGPVIDASWALGNDERKINFAERAVHRTAEVAKAIIDGYYAQPIEHSYFIGCSRGGGQAMIEAQRFPEDFDGIVAMAPAYSWARLGTAFLQNQQRLYPDSQSLGPPVVSSQSRELLAKTITERCDADDGVSDGLLTDPRQCDFEPAELLCQGSAGDGCLSAEQLAAVERIYSGPSIDGVNVFPGFPYGAENLRGGWDLWTTGADKPMAPGLPNLHFAFGTQLFKYFIFDDPDFDYSTYDFANWQADIAAADEMLSASNPDLSAFRDAGGKLLLWHGWADPALTPLATIDYYEAVEAVDPQASDYTRLFLAPGVLHCNGGAGPDSVDLVSALVDWVENGTAPERLTASKLGSGGEVLMSRPLCAYPQVAVWDGRGDTNDASSFSCSLPPA